MSSENTENLQTTPVVEIKKLVLKGLNCQKLIHQLKKTAAFDDSMQLYIKKDKIVCLKVNLQETSGKLWEIMLSEIVQNHEEIAKQIEDNIVRFGLLSTAQFVKQCLLLFKEAVDLELQVNSMNDVVGLCTVSNNNIKIKLSTADANKAFEELQGEWKDVYNFFSVDNAESTFALTAEDIKKIKTLAGINTVVEKKIEYFAIKSQDGKLKVLTHAVEWDVHDTAIELPEIKIQTSLLKLIDEDDYVCGLKHYNNAPLLVIKSSTCSTMQYIQLLSAINTTIDIEAIEEKIGAVTFEDWVNDADNPVF